MHILDAASEQCPLRNLEACPVSSDAAVDSTLCEFLSMSSCHQRRRVFVWASWTSSDSNCYVGPHPLQENNLADRVAALHTAGISRDPFQNLFIGLGDHSADKALLALTDAVHADQRDMNAYEWITQALPGATLKPAFAFGTVGELYRSFTRPEELARLNRLSRF